MPQRSQVHRRQGEQAAVRLFGFHTDPLQANVEGWTPASGDPNSGTGNSGSCCAEMDIWEAVSKARVRFMVKSLTSLIRTRSRLPLLLTPALLTVLALATPPAVLASLATTVTATRMVVISTPTDSELQTFSDLARLLTPSLR